MSLTSYRAAPPRDTMFGLGVPALWQFCFLDRRAIQRRAAFPRATDVCVDCDAKRGLGGPLLEGTKALEIVNGFSLRRL